MRRVWWGWTAWWAVAWSVGAGAAEVRVAVAANFTTPMQQIARSFEQATGHKAILSIGSTGRFYAQIRNGAPYDVLLAADDETPLRIEKEGLGVAGSRFTYARGRLVLWSKQAGRVDGQGAVLRSDAIQRLAVADPKLSPYGAAAFETLAHMGLLNSLRSKWVQAENVAQTYQFIATENAPLGFVALSQVFANGQLNQGSAWIVPARMHAPILQDAVLLTRGQTNAAALDLMHYLRSEPALAVIRAYGYE
jgi:molybdate transport system substrate-binding protein